MGQYYFVCNLDKKQYLHPHRFDDGLKLLEFGCSGGGTMTALALLVADGNGRGGGDARSGSDVIGSWAGDRIVIAGDYADAGKFVEGDENLHDVASESYEEISEKILAAMREDGTCLR